MTKTEIREMLRHAISKTSVVGDELYYPASWRFGEGGRGASTSEPLRRHDRTPRQAAVQVATCAVGNKLNINVWFSRAEDATIVNAVQLIHNALKGGA
jgi:hypothetical protein